MHGERRDQIRGRELRATDVQAVLASGLIIPSYFNSSVYGLVGDITTIAPDDAAAAGSNVRLARSDHRHAFTSAVAASLTKTATNSEGSASTHARSDHGHNTEAMAWGMLAAPSVLTADSSLTSGTTDLDLGVDQTVTVGANRRILLVFNYRGLAADAGVAVVAFLKFKESGSTINERQIVPTDAANSAGDGNTFMHAINGPSQGSHTYEMFLQKASGGANIKVQAAATYPAQFFVLDMGSSV